MIPAIGLMMGAYIFTRMFEVLVKGSNLGDVLTRILAVLTMVITAICVLVLLLSGATIPSMPR